MSLNAASRETVVSVLGGGIICTTYPPAIHEDVHNLGLLHNFAAVYIQESLHRKWSEWGDSKSIRNLRSLSTKSAAPWHLTHNQTYLLHPIKLPGTDGPQIQCIGPSTLECSNKAVDSNDLIVVPTQWLKCWFRIEFSSNNEHAHRWHRARAPRQLMVCTVWSYRYDT